MRAETDENMTLLEKSAIHQLFAKAGNMANPATDERRRRFLGKVFLRR